MRELEVNGTKIANEGPPGTTLLAVLRAAGLTGTKEACGRGECGACTVLVGGEPMMSCLVLAMLVRKPVTTIEGLDADDLRGAFADAGAFQCGFCTPGQLVRAEALLRRRAGDTGDTGDDADHAAGEPDEIGALDEATVRHELSGNVCRCTGYAQIVDAVLRTAERRGLAVRDEPAGRAASVPLPRPTAARAPERAQQ